MNHHFQKLLVRRSADYFCSKISFFASKFEKSDNKHAESEGGAYNSHLQKATVFIISLPGNVQLAEYTEKVKKLNLIFMSLPARLKPRKNIAPTPMPERIEEP